MIASLWSDFIEVLTALVSAIPYLFAYIGLILLSMFIWTWIRRFITPKKDYGSLKTVTFGDEASVKSNTTASIISVVLIFFLWASFTGSVLLPRFLHAPAPYTGDGSFTYVVKAPDGTLDESTVYWRVRPEDVDSIDPPAAEDGDGFALNDTLIIPEFRTEILLWDRNDEFSRSDGALIVEVNGEAVDFDPNNRDDGDRLTQKRPVIDIDNGTVTFTEKGALSVAPYQGMQMEEIWLPSPESVWKQVIVVSKEGFRNVTLIEHLAYSLFRVILGFIIGAIVGIPLGYAMGLSNWFRGWFDPIVEFMRPVPPLALIPLVIIWAGIGEVGKIILLFMAALWIMAIAARSGVSGVRISKVHAAYSLGASKWQIMRHVIIPNSLPEIFTGARVSMGVCWGTVVAAELVAAQKGAGMMISVASGFQRTDIVVMGIILIGLIGFSIDVLMRLAERWLVPWKGKG